MANGKPAAKNGRVINLDTVRAEITGEPVALTFKGQEFTLPPEMPLSFAVYASAGELLKAVTALFGDDTDRFLGLNPSLSDFEALAEQAGQVYGTTEGEAAASSDS